MNWIAAVYNWNVGKREVRNDFATFAKQFVTEAVFGGLLCFSLFYIFGAYYFCPEVGGLMFVFFNAYVDEL